MNSIHIWTTRVVAAAACVAATLPASAQAQTGWAECQQAAVGAVWSTAPCLATPNFTLLRTDNYGYSASTPAPLRIERMDDTSISLLGEVSYDGGVGPYYGAGYPGGYFSTSREVGPIVEGVAAGEFEFVDHALTADMEVTSWSYSSGSPGTVKTLPETSTVNFAVNDAPRESFASLAAYRQTHGASSRGPFTVYGRDQYSQGPNGTAGSDFGSSNAITAFRLTASVQAVPEPGSWALMGLGLLGMAARLRRQPC
jgi:PEP-CTERM motif